MFSWDSSWKEKEIAQGQFFCPTCNEARPYKQKRIAKDFMFYFVPLFETRKLGEFVDCQICQSRFDLKILSPDSQAALKLVSPTKYLLHHGASLIEARAKLISTGLKDELAEMVLQMAQR